MLRRLSPLHVTAALLAGVLTVGFAGPVLAAPVGRSTTADTDLAATLLGDRGIHDARLHVPTVEGLTLVNEAGIIGYVNMFAGDGTVYLKPFNDPASFRSDTAFYSNTLNHEYGHILQKRLVEKNSAAGPSREPPSFSSWSSSLLPCQPP